MIRLSIWETHYWSLRHNLNYLQAKQFITLSFYTAIIHIKCAGFFKTYTTIKKSNMLHSLFCWCLWSCFIAPHVYNSELYLFNVYILHEVTCHRNREDIQETENIGIGLLVTFSYYSNKNTTNTTTAKRMTQTFLSNWFHLKCINFIDLHAADP